MTSRLVKEPGNPHPLALVDLDGTLADFDGAMRLGMRKLASPDEVFIWNREGDKYPHLRARRELVMRQQGFFRNLEPIKRNMMLVDHIAGMGFDLHILTKGPMYAPNAWTEKLEWCQKHLRPGTPLTITQNKELVYGKLLVDDWTPYVERWLEVRPRGLAIIPATKANVGFYHPRAERFTGTRSNWKLVHRRLLAHYRQILQSQE